MPRFINGKEKAKNYFISVAGILGSGKTTACKLLAQALRCKLFEENVADNAFLPLFYKDPKRWALHSQLFYLSNKVSQLQHLRELAGFSSIVQDSPIYQDAYTYAKAQHKLGNMTPEEYELYEQFLASFKRDLPHPDIIVQLDASPETLLYRIKDRGRGYEQGVTLEYLKTLSSLQDQWIKERPQLNVARVDTENLNIVSDPTNQKQFIHAILAKLK